MYLRSADFPFFRKVIFSLAMKTARLSKLKSEHLGAALLTQWCGMFAGLGLFVQKSDAHDASNSLLILASLQKSEAQPSAPFRRPLRNMMAYRNRFRAMYGTAVGTADIGLSAEASL